MSNVKNFGLIGVGSDVQYGKGGPRLLINTGIFNFRNANNSGDVGIATSSILSSAGNVTLTTGNVVLSSTSGTISIGGDTTISRQQSGVFLLSGTGALMVPNGTTADRPAAAQPAMVRFNDDTDSLEYYTGSSWVTLSTGGSVVGIQAEIDAIEVSLGPAITGTGTFVPTAFTGSAAGSTSFTNAIQKVANTADAASGLYVDVAGDTMTGTLTMSGASVQIVLPNPPTIGTHAVNRDYVDAKIAGLSWKTPVVAASAGTNISVTSPPGTLDGITLATNDRILLKDQTTNTENLIYIFNGTGVALTPAPDADTPAELVNATVFVSGGTTNADTGWTQIGVLGGGTVQWVQFTGGSTYVAGAGLTLSANTFNVGAGSGILVGADDVSLGLFSTTSGGLILTTDGTNRSSAASAKLSILLPAGSSLTQDTTGLYIPLGGIANTKLANSSIIFAGNTGGTTTVPLGGTFTITGVSSQGISTATSANTVTVTAADATNVQKGVSTFTTGQFVVTAGNVALGTVPVGSLPGSGSITFTGTSGTDPVALGESMAIIGADSAITTTMGVNSLTILLNTVTVGKGGTGVTNMPSGQLLIGNGTSPAVFDSDLAFNTTTNALTVGSALLTGTAAGDVTLSATATNGNINLFPNTTGNVIIGTGGPGIIRSNTTQPLTVRGTTTLSLESVTGSTSMILPAGTTAKVSISGPTASQYASGLAANDLVNRQYVDQFIPAGGVKTVSTTVSLATPGTTTIGAALAAGSTILSVKVLVNTTDSGAGTLSVGKPGSNAAYMLTTENDPQTLGLYLAETLVLEPGSVQVQATVGGAPASGSATVIVMYQ